jgi:hypothetical protein
MAMLSIITVDGPNQDAECAAMHCARKAYVGNVCKRCSAFFCNKCVKRHPCDERQRDITEAKTAGNLIVGLMMHYIRFPQFEETSTELGKSLTIHAIFPESSINVLPGIIARIDRYNDNETKELVEYIASTLEMFSPELRIGYSNRSSEPALPVDEVELFVLTDFGDTPQTKVSTVLHSALYPSMFTMDDFPSILALFTENQRIPYILVQSEQRLQYRRSCIEENRETCNNPGCIYTGGDSGFYLSRCKGCIITRYCSRECQSADWKSHKGECKKLRSRNK